MKGSNYMLVLILLLPACKSAEKLADERAQMERDYLRSLQGKYADSNYISFPITLPGGTAQLRLQANCPDFDSGTVKSEGGQLTIQAPCPPVTVNADSIIRNSAAYKAALINRHAADMRADSVVQQNAVLTADRNRFKTERNMAYKWLSGITGAILVGLLAWWKLGTVTGLISKLFK